MKCPVLTIVLCSNCIYWKPFSTHSHSIRSTRKRHPDSWSILTLLIMMVMRFHFRNQLLCIRLSNTQIPDWQVNWNTHLIKHGHTQQIKQQQSNGKSAPGTNLSISLPYYKWRGGGITFVRIPAVSEFPDDIWKCPAAKMKNPASRIVNKMTKVMLVLILQTRMTKRASPQQTR